MNESLKQIHSMLIKRVLQFSEILGTVTDPELANTISNEMQELNHRINLIQRFLFIEESQRISSKLPALRDANAKLERAAKSIEKITGIVKSATAFLKLVDQVIDTAKVIV